MLYVDDNQLDVKLKGRIFALDSTVIDLCLNVFWWATFRKAKAARVHLLIHTEMESLLEQSHSKITHLRPHTETLTRTDP